MIDQILIAIVLIALILFAVLDFSSFKHWLLYAVIKAESFLGSKTGKLKLEYVYNLALVKYPMITKFIPFALFTKLVNSSLKVMQSILSENEEINNVVQQKRLTEDDKK